MKRRQTYPIKVTALVDRGAVDLSQDIDALEPEVIIIETPAVARRIVRALLAVFGDDALPRGIDTERYWRNDSVQRTKLDASPDATLTLLLISGTLERYGEELDTDKLLGTIRVWTQEDREAVCDWAAKVHLRASDNHNVRVPAVPECVKPLLPTMRNRPEGGGDHV